MKNIISLAKCFLIKQYVFAYFVTKLLFFVLLFSPLRARLPADSPNSILKMKLCPPLNFFPNSTSSDRSDRSSYDNGSSTEHQDQKKQLLPSSPPPPCYTLFETHLGSSPTTVSAIKSISRGPDDHFIALPYLEDTINIKRKKEFSQSPGHNNGERSKSGSFRDALKSCSVRSEKVIKGQVSAEQDSYSKCLTLMKEKEELKNFTISHRAQKCENEQRQTKSASPVRRWTGVNLDEPISKPQDIPLRQKKQRPNSLAKQVSEYRRGCYFGNTSSPMERLLTSTSPCIQWDISPVTSPTNKVVALSLSEGNTTDCMTPDTPQRVLEAVENLAAEDFSHSPVTQYTSLSVISHHRDSPSCSESGIGKAQPRCPKRLGDKKLSSTRILTEDHCLQEREIKTQANVSLPACPVPCSFQHPGTCERTQHSAAEGGKEASPEGHITKLSTDLSHSFTGCSTITNGNQRSGSESKTIDKPSPSSLQPEEETEGIRAGSRKSDKCVFSVSPNYISPLPLLKNETESDQSNFSIRLSESLKAKIVSQPDRMSPLQPSTILEYLSLPGFVEMSVDEPTEPQAESTWLGTKQADGTLLRGEPDVVPKNWENQGHYHVEESDDNQSRVLVDFNIPVIPVGSTVPETVASSKPCLELAQENASIITGSSETKCISPQYLAYEGSISQQLLSHKSHGSDKPAHFSSAQPLVSPKVVYNIPYQGERIKESLSEHAQWRQPQNKGTNQVTTWISQAPVPFMKKSISTGPCRTLSGMGQPRPFLRKSVSLGSQKSKIEHHQSSTTYASDNFHKDELPHLSVKDKSYNLGCTPANSYLRTGPSWQGTGHAKSYSSYGLERPCYSERPHMTPSSLMHPYGLSVLSPYRQESDPRRQAAVFPECPLSYPETLRLVQHRYVPQGPPRPLIAPRLVARWDHPHPVDSRKSFQRPFLPRGYSWPTSHQAAFPSGQIQRELYGVGMGEGRDSTGEGGRTSYASQSSGRGSVGPFGHLRQSLSITPTLLSSPETTEEIDRRKSETNLRERRSKR